MPDNIPTMSQKVQSAGIFFFQALSLSAIFIIGWWISQSSWNQKTFIYFNDTPYSNNSSRNIASVKSFQAISPSLIFKKGLAKPQNQKILTHASQISSQTDSIQIHLSHFILLDSNGEKTLPCHHYQTIDLFFIAHQESVHGHIPQMVLKTKCSSISKNSKHIGPFLIPKKKIIQSHVTQQLFHSNVDKTQNGTIILFSHLGLFWPKEWILTQIRLSNSRTKKDFTIQFTSQQPKDYLKVELY